MNLEQLNIAYDLDGGGYSFESPLGSFKGLTEAVVVWEDPDADYIPWIRDATETPWDCLYAFAPNSGHFNAYEWPEVITDTDGDELVLVGKGFLHHTDRECNCFGRFQEWTGAAGEPREPLPDSTVLRWARDHNVPLLPQAEQVFWEFSGNVDDPAYPDCHRCDGDGHVDSVGGEWAVYQRVEEA